MTVRKRIRAVFQRSGSCGELFGPVRKARGSGGQCAGSAREFFRAGSKLTGSGREGRRAVGEIIRAGFQGLCSGRQLFRAFRRRADAVGIGNQAEIERIIAVQRGLQGDDLLAPSEAAASCAWTSGPAIVSAIAF